MFWGRKKSGLRDCWDIENFRRDLGFPTDFPPECGRPTLLILPYICLQSKVGSDLPFWTIVKRKAYIIKMLSSALAIEYVKLMRPDVQLVAQGGCKCSLAHHRSSRMMPLKCARGGVFSFPKQASSACGVLVSLAREPSMRTLCSVVFPPACSPWWLPGFKSSICHVLALCLRAIILTLLSLSLHISKGTCKKWVQ